MNSFLRSLLLFVATVSISMGYSQSIPLAEHPRPDFERPNWQNLNGQWAFAFDSLDVGMSQTWQSGNKKFDQTIMVPFPWGSELSGVEDEADIGWYQREITVAESWKDKRTFLTIGAADWETTVWLDGEYIGKHQGGYVPFSFELTDHLTHGSPQQLVIRVDDARRMFTLYGKQGYGNARGIWQTIYLEGRGKHYMEALHFTPDIDQNQVRAMVYLPEDADESLSFSISIPNANPPISQQMTIEQGQHKAYVDIEIPDAHWWSLDDPFLYEVTAQLEDDEVSAYFGMRKISVVNLPGTQYPYIALNDQPIYMQLALDQSYHPEGFYTFPSDQFMREEIERSKSIGLNGIRTHIKVEVPRKLYWADKLGLLVMEDLPNSWGEPDEKMQAESEYTLRKMIERDYNHPSIFSWCVFNETWGLHTNFIKNGKKQRDYLPQTQQWVASMYYLAKSLDMTRLVEDNSICCGRGHTETDINSWHVYLPGWEWDTYLSNLTTNTYPGSTHHFESGFQQGKQPNINSECGNVWGYEGSTGDVDWSWDYHRMLNTFRLYPKVGGWLYTEHHDVINEWNGYWRFDRSEKETGMGHIVAGMSLNDLHAPIYLSTGNEICKTVKGGAEIEIPLFLSSMTGEELGKELQIDYELSMMNYIGETEKHLSGSRKVAYRPWMQKALEPLSLSVPDMAGLAVVKLWVKDEQGNILHRNFMHLEIESETSLPSIQVLSQAPDQHVNSEWSKKQWNVQEGLKVNGAGSGFFAYEFTLPADVRINKVKEAYFLVEVSAKELFVKDQEEFDRNQDYMKGSRVANSSNPNAYPMTDEVAYPSPISVYMEGKRMITETLPDDPADHRGVLSWHHQLQDRKLREAGSYGYSLKVPIPRKMLSTSSQSGKLRVRIQTEGQGGIAVYGKSYGRFPWDPSLVLRYK